jgi:hypothetical protein
MFVRVLVGRRAVLVGFAAVLVGGDSMFLRLVVPFMLVMVGGHAVVLGSRLMVSRCVEVVLGRRVLRVRHDYTFLIEMPRGAPPRQPRDNHCADIRTRLRVGPNYSAVEFSVIGKNR